jgi:transposase
MSEPELSLVYRMSSRQAGMHKETVLKRRRKRKRGGGGGRRRRRRRRRRRKGEGGGRRGEGGRGKSVQLCKPSTVNPTLYYTSSKFIFLTTFTSV